MTLCKSRTELCQTCTVGGVNIVTESHYTAFNTLYQVSTWSESDSDMIYINYLYMWAHVPTPLKQLIPTSN